MRYEVRVAGRVVRVDIDQQSRFLIDGDAVAAETEETVRGRQWSVRIAGRTHEITALTLEPLRLLVNGRELAVSASDERSLAAARGARRGGALRHEIRAPMPGLLKSVNVSEGDVVERDAALLVLEAMKMENELRAPAHGRVVKLTARAGTKVEGGTVLAVLAESE